MRILLRKITQVVLQQLLLSIDNLLRLVICNTMHTKIPFVKSNFLKTFFVLS